MRYTSAFFNSAKRKSESVNLKHTQRHKCLKLNSSKMSSPPFLDTATGCIYLDDRTPCGSDYYGYPIKVGIIPGFTDYSTLVEYLSGYNQTAAAANDISNTYSCQGDITRQVTGLRYQTSLICSKLALFSLLPSNQTLIPNIAGGGCTLLDISDRTALPTGPLICKDECNIAINGLADIYQSPQLCTNNTAIQTQQSNNICNSISSISSYIGGICLPSVERESATCGFKTMELAMSNCPNLNDQCCTDLKAKPRIIVSDKIDGQVQKLNFIMYFVLGGIAVVTAAVFIILACVKKRTLNKTSAVAENEMESAPIAPTVLNTKNVDSEDPAIHSSSPLEFSDKMKSPPPIPPKKAVKKSPITQSAIPTSQLVPISLNLPSSIAEFDITDIADNYMRYTSTYIAKYNTINK